MSTFASKLKSARLAATLSVTEAAKAAKTSYGYWYELESGKKQPTIEKLVDIAAAVRVHPSYLLPDANPEKNIENISAVAV